MQSWQLIQSVPSQAAQASMCCEDISVNSHESGMILIKICQDRSASKH